MDAKLRIIKAVGGGALLLVLLLLGLGSRGGGGGGKGKPEKASKASKGEPKNEAQADEWLSGTMAGSENQAPKKAKGSRPKSK